MNEEGRVDESKRPDASLSDWAVLGWGIFVGVAVVALLIAAYVIGVQKGESNSLEQATGTVASQPVTDTAPAAGAAVDAASAATFTSTCGGCHTLAAAGTTGTAGPDLDDLGPTTAQVLTAIQNGGAGSGQMPAGLLSGAQAQKVAEYVSATAGG